MTSLDLSFSGVGFVTAAWGGTAWFLVGVRNGSNVVLRSTNGLSNWTTVATLGTTASMGQPYRIRSRTVLPFLPEPPTSTPTLVVTEVSGTSLIVSGENWNRYFYLTNSGFNALTLPSETSTGEGGRFWTLRNATNSTLSITLTNTLSLTSPLLISPLNAVTLAISGGTANTILLL